MRLVVMTLVVLASLGCSPGIAGSTPTAKPMPTQQSASTPTPVGSRDWIPTPIPAKAISTTAPNQPGKGQVYYANCTAAKRAGAAPIYRGEPGYRSALDRDGDGVACE